MLKIYAVLIFNSIRLPSNFKIYLNVCLKEEFVRIETYVIMHTRGGSSHEPARFGSARAGFSLARPGSLVNFGSSS